MSTNPPRGPGRGRERDNLDDAYRGRGGPQAGRGRGRGEDRGDERGRGRGGGRGRARGDVRGGPPRFQGRGRGDFDRARGGGRGQRGRGGPRPDRAPPEVFAPDTPAALEPRIAELDALARSFADVRLKDPQMPLRPRFGTVGRAQTLRANVFALRVPEGYTIYDYEVAISPAKGLRRAQKARIFDRLEGCPECEPFRDRIAHDQSARIVSAVELPQPLEVVVHYADEHAEEAERGVTAYTVAVKYVRTLNKSGIDSHLGGKDKARAVNTLPHISALNLVVQKYASQHGVRVGGDEERDEKKRQGKGKYFFPAEERIHLMSGLEACRGFFVSVRPNFKQLMVNINACMTAFYKAGNLADVMFACLQEAGALPDEFFERVRVEMTYLGYPKRKPIHKILGTTSRNTTFKHGQYGEITVEEYFKRAHQSITLRYADSLPVISIKKKDGFELIPPELCEILPNQPYRGELPQNATRAMIEAACKPPAFNANMIVNRGFDLLGLRGGDTSVLTNFGIDVDPNMAAVPSRVLPPPRVTYKSGQPRVRDGGWNLVGVEFHSGADMSDWAVLLVDEGSQFRGPQDPQLAAFLTAFADVCRASGLTVTGGPSLIMQTKRLPPAGRDAGRRRGLALIREELAAKLTPGRPPRVVLVLLSSADVYPGLKRLCDMELGVPTVCMLLAKAREPFRQAQYFANVALKVNVKLGGTNHLLAPQSMRWLREKKTMLVGIDVTHPSPQSLKGTPSIVAVVASVDDDFVQFPAGLALQRNRNIDKDSEEMVEGLAGLLEDRIRLYQKRTKSLPERILVYRDGVSEGQYLLSLKHELPKIKKACEKFRSSDRKAPYSPTISFIVCGKRHHTRFFATEANQTTSNGNTQPGTVVDKGVTDIYNHDFYLQAHSGLKGTVKATHYVVIYDENNISADAIQVGTNAASYMYARATKAVSLVPPAYYADLACERGRQWLSQVMNATSSELRAQVNGTRNPDQAMRARQRVFDEAKRLWGDGPHEAIKDTMFYI
ncbi:Piwi-domain-containing protein [Phanerochaete sordida]|uniref:Piwi-domain-containing protein n=1 Tax=Phanerochaete sordida TaxID=48140 RepID=A0A9P3GR28_9APHY|nr:Piwi-domain-containing protein [Phanerochaete sordida]